MPQSAAAPSAAQIDQAQIDAIKAQARAMAALPGKHGPHAQMGFILGAMQCAIHDAARLHLMAMGYSELDAIRRAEAMQQAASQYLAGG